MSESERRVCRLLVVTDTFPLAPGRGTQRSVSIGELCEDLADAGHVVSVLAPGVPGKQHKFRGVQIERFRWRGEGEPLSHPFGLSDPIRTSNYLRRGLEEARQEAMRVYPQMTLAFGVFPSGVIGRGLLELFGIPYTVWGQGNALQKHYRFGLKTVVRQVLNQAGWCAADSKVMREKIARLRGEGCEFWPMAMRSCPNGEAVVKKKARKFVCVVSREQEEATELMLRAFAKAMHQMRDAELMMIIEGASRRWLEEKVKAHGAGARVTCLEGGRAEIREAFATGDAVVIPTASGLPLTFGEAMAAKRMALVSEGCDVLSWIAGVGEVFSEGDEGDLADVLWRAYHQGIAVEERKFATTAAELSSCLGRERLLEIIASIMQRG